MNCGTKRFSGGIFPSSSVLFTGTLPSFIPANSVPCDANLDEILEKMNLKLSSLLDSENLTELDRKCLVFNPLAVKAKDLHQLEIDKICALQTSMDVLVAQVNNLNIGSKLVTIDLKCLKPSAAPCAVGNDTYSLLSILNILVNEICLLKNP